MIKVGVSKLSFSPGLIQYSWTSPYGSTPSTGDNIDMPLTLWHPNFMKLVIMWLPEEWAKRKVFSKSILKSESNPAIDRKKCQFQPDSKIGHEQKIESKTNIHFAFAKIFPPNSKSSKHHLSKWKIHIVTYVSNIS